MSDLFSNVFIFNKQNTIQGMQNSITFNLYLYYKLCPSVLILMVICIYIDICCLVFS